MGDSDTGQVSADAAKEYEAVYLPSLFQEWCPLALRAANIKAGVSVVDIACGTGVLALAAADRVGPDGKVVGVDINQGMLSIARSKSSCIEWLEAPAENLPFSDNHFDNVVSQFGLMYFEEPEVALKEMMRVLKPGGSMAVTVWNNLDNNPGLAAEEHLWQRVFGEEIDETPFRLGDTEGLKSLFGASGMKNIEIKTHSGTARFDSIESWIHTGAKGWTEDDALSDDELELLLKTAERELTEFETAHGTVTFPTSAHIVTVRKQLD